MDLTDLAVDDSHLHKMAIKHTKHFRNTEKYMKHKTIFLSGLCLVGTMSIAQADHNSVWGPGQANMPNDIHNIRIDTMDDDVDFSELVSHGIGADTVNRYLDSEATVAAMDNGQGTDSDNGGGSGSGGGR